MYLALVIKGLISMVPTLVTVFIVNIRSAYDHFHPPNAKNGNATQFAGFPSPLATVSNKWCLIFTIRRANTVPQRVSKLHARRVPPNNESPIRSRYIKKHLVEIFITLWRFRAADLAAISEQSLFARYGICRVRVYHSSRMKITETLPRLKFGWKPGSLFG